MTFWFLAFKPSIAESLTDQLIKLEGMYDRGTITKQEFEKLKSNLFETIEDSIEKEKEEKFEHEQKLKLQEELIREQKFKERELSTKEGYDDQDSGVSTSTLENFKIDKTSQN